MVAGQWRGRQRPRSELGGGRRQVDPDAGQRVRYRAEGQDALEAGTRAEQFSGSLGVERVDDQGRQPRVVDHVGLVGG